MKRQLIYVMCIGLAALAMAGCSNVGTKEETSTAQKQETTGEKSKAVADREVVNYWYIHTGDEANVEEEAIAAYNASQDKYRVEGLSVSDNQKLIVAMSSNEAPDVIFSTNANLITFQANGLVEKVDSYVERDGINLDAWSDQAIETVSFDEGIYGLPLSCSTIQMFYNKDLLQQAGYSEPPKTMEELYEMAEVVTTVDESGNIDILGYPLFPLASARQELIYAFGGRWWSEDGTKVTPDSQGILDSLNMNLQFREKYGIEKVQAFVSTANTNRYSEQDMFFTGKQLFRFDGAWLTAMIENNNPDLNYGITLIPGTEKNPALRGTARYETSVIAIPTGASNKEGAWDFTKWLTGPEGAKIIELGIGHLPVLEELYEDEDILAAPAYSTFIESLKNENAVLYPKIADYSKYTALIDEYLDYVYNGIKTPEEAMEELAKQAAVVE